MSEWKEVLKLLAIFRSLKFLNLSNNLLSDPLLLSKAELSVLSPLPLRKLVLNGNKLDWKSVNALTSAMPHLEELHLTNAFTELIDSKWYLGDLKDILLTSNMTKLYKLHLEQNEIW